MTSVMVATKINGVMEAVGTIDADDKGFTFSTDEKDLHGILLRVQRDGVETVTGGGTQDGREVDVGQAVKINDSTLGYLTRHLEMYGYAMWYDDSDEEQETAAGKMPELQSQGKIKP